jgi:hypothetical protein
VSVNAEAILSNSYKKVKIKRLLIPFLFVLFIRYNPPDSESTEGVTIKLKLKWLQLF